MNIKSVILVVVQFACIIFILMTGPAIAQNIFLFLIELSAIALGIYSILVINIHNIFVFPDVKSGAKLVMKGPYHFIRHPMYSAVLLFSLTLLIDRFNFYRLIVYLILLVNLLIKLHYEEGLLQNKFPEYREYKKRTKKLIPFVY